MTKDTAAPRPARGRPRNEESREAILAATVDLLTELGYQDLTIEGIARRAGVGKATIYRWWKSKGLLVFEAVFTTTEQAPVPNTGSLMKDLRIMMSRLTREFSSPAANAALAGLVADFVGDPELSTVIRRDFLVPARDRLIEIFDRAEERGELRPSVRPRLVLDALAGAVVYRSLMLGERSGRAVGNELAEVVLNGIGARPL